MHRNVSFSKETLLQEDDETHQERKILYMSDHRSWAPETDEQPYENYGFVEVDDGQELFGEFDTAKTPKYSLKRSKSTNSIDREASLAQVNRNLERQLRALRVEVNRLKKHVAFFEQFNERWGVRYSKRVAFLANLVLGLWIAWSSFLRYIQKRRRTLLTQVVVPLGKPRIASFNRILLSALLAALSQSWGFLLGAYLLSRRTPWKRTLGSGLSSVCSLYLALVSDFFPWTNYFNILTNMLYITADFRLRSVDGNAPSLEEYQRQDNMD